MPSSRFSAIDRSLAFVLIAAAVVACSPVEDVDSDAAELRKLSCNDECVDETKELWLFTGLDGCGVTWSMYLRVRAGAAVAVGQTTDYPAWEDNYDCDGNGSMETPSSADIGEFLKQPFVDGTCVSFCTLGSGFHDAALEEADSLCFTPSSTTLYFDVE